MGKKRNSCKIMIRKPEGRQTTLKTLAWVGIKVTELCSVDWLDLPLDSDK